jgi:hypothetical protein
MSQPVFPIRSINRLADLLECPKKSLLELAADPQRYYKPTILERVGKQPRPIYVPRPPLARVQRRIFERLFSAFTPHPCSFGGVKSRSASSNARLHLDRSFVLKLDVRKFYPSIHHRWVHNFFENRLGCVPPVANMLRRLLTLEGGLPQGTCTSPALADQIMRPIDDRLQKALCPRNIIYSRWIDDITLSAQFSLRSFVPFISRILKEYGLNLHMEGDKRPLQFGPGEEAVVTGLTCRCGIGVPKHYVDSIVRELLIAERFGLGRSGELPPYCKETYWGTIEYIGRYSRQQHRRLRTVFDRVRWDRLQPLDLPSKRPRLRDRLDKVEGICFDCKGTVDSK